ncbi:hypothetical protein M1D96_12165 [Pseudomonas sp. D1-3]|uniref:hypothetical protein n=1 Tax=Phytopseudomonas argentinensis TaxID=289370 RepID=UPI0008AA1AF9|nr:hypothetical protein [Pseudomonas argentinensis]
MKYATFCPLATIERLCRGTTTVLAVAASLGLLAGCTASEDSQNEVSNDSPLASTSTKLSPLDERDIAANPLKGELICAFSVGRNTLLYAAGNVATQADAEAIVKFADQVMTVRAPGGFDQMLQGTTFKGERLVIEVKLTEQPHKADGNGASVYPSATLTYIRNDSAMRSEQGQWECGP